MPEYKEQIRNRILQKIFTARHLHKKDIKAVIDEIKMQYLWDSKIQLDDLRKIISYFKENWQELKRQAQEMRKIGNFIEFASYQIGA